MDTINTLSARKSIYCMDKALERIIVLMKYFAAVYVVVSSGPCKLGSNRKYCYKKYIFYNKEKFLFNSKILNGIVILHK